MNKLILFILSYFLIFDCQSQVNTGLIAKYYFNNGDAKDDGGKYHGKVNGAVLTTDRFGNINKAYQFGANQNITIKDTDALDGMANAFSISFWVKSATVNNSNSLISKFSYCGGGSDAYNIYISDKNTLISQLDDEFGYDTYQIGKKIITDNNWHHIVVIWDKPNVKFYIDTVLDTYSTYNPFNSTLSNSDEVLAFGHPATVLCPYTYSFNEKLDDIRIYNRALSKKEVDTLYNELNPTLINSSILLSTENLISIYPNPSNGIVNFTGIHIPTKIDLYSIEGRILKSYFTKDSLNLSDLKSGIYLLKIENNMYKISLTN